MSAFGVKRTSFRVTLPFLPSVLLDVIVSKAGPKLDLRPTWPSHLFVRKAYSSKIYPGDGDMSSKADEYRRYGAQALASAEQAASKKEKAELLKIAEVWSELATEQ